MATVKNLGDFFTSSKKKKKVKPTNLNAPKEEQEVEKPKKKEEKKDGEWDETESKEPVPKAELGNLAKEEEEDESAKPRQKQAWSTTKANAPPTTSGSRFADMKKFPSLAVSASGMPVGTLVMQEEVYDKAKKNLFAGLEEPDSDDDKPARQQGTSKKRGENIAVTVEEAPLDKAAQLRKDARLQKKEEKNAKRLELKASRIDASAPSDAASEIDLPADCRIPMDAIGAKKKYDGRRKLPVAELPKSELREELPDAELVKSEEKVPRKKLKVQKVEKTKKELLYVEDAW